MKGRMCIVRDGRIIQLLTSNLDNEEFRLDILKVQEINKVIDIIRIPNASAFVEGVINPRGKIVPIVDLRKGLGFDRRSFDKSTRVIVVEFNSMVLGVIVDSASEVLRISENGPEHPLHVVCGIDSECIEGGTEIGE
jgi:purine-binding chemotaxis protein CheW